MDIAPIFFCRRAKEMKRKLYLFLLMLIAIPLFQPGGGFAFGQTTYYVSSSTGNDANNGTSISTPWKTMDQVSKKTYVAGDQVLFNRGDTFSVGSIYATFPGTSAQPCVVASYGTGAKPLFIGDMTGGVWTKRPGYDSIWQAFAGNMFAGSTGFEDSAGTWRLIVQNSQQTKFYLSNAESLSTYLNSFKRSSYGPGSASNGWDTIYVRTWDGNAPQVKIFHINSFFGSYLTIRDLDCERWKTGVSIGSSVQSCNHLSVRNIYTKNCRYIAISVYMSSNSLIDSCRSDSTGYTAMYEFGGHNNLWTYDTTNVISDSILGTVGTGEFSAIGFQQDTSIVADHIYTTGAATGNSFDTFYNVNDTVRDSHFVNNEAGMYLDGTGWVAYNDTILVAGRYNPGISVTQRGATQTSATNCVMDVNGGGASSKFFHRNGSYCFRE